MLPFWDREYKVRTLGHLGIALAHAWFLLRLPCSTLSGPSFFQPTPFEQRESQGQRRLTRLVAPKAGAQQLRAVGYQKVPGFPLWPTARSGWVQPQQKLNNSSFS